MAYAFRSAQEIVALYRSGEARPSDVVEETLGRIDALNPTLNAFLTVTPEIARAQAARADTAYADARQGGDPAALPPLLGVPVSVKDLHDVAGVRTTHGSRAFADNVARASGIPWERLEAAGAVLLGKTNTPEFGLITVTDNDLGGPAGTPWSPERIAGGSSGGAAAAVAAGLGPLAHGSDGGGSIRVPAAYCGVVGIKPTQGRIPKAVPRDPGMPQLSSEGPLARTVRDAAIMLQVMAGPDPRDPTSFQGPQPDYLAACERTGLGDLRIAWSLDLGFATVAYPVRANAERALARLREAGAVVEEATPEIPYPFDIFAPIALAGAAANHGALYDADPELLTKYVRRTVEHGREVDGAAVVRAYAELERFRALMRRFFADYDLLLTPTVAVPAYPHGQRLREIEGKPAIPFWGATPFTAPFNMTHQPGISVPTGFDPQGLPTAIQIVARLGEDDTALRAAAAIEEAMPWAGAVPPLTRDTAGETSA